MYNSLATEDQGIELLYRGRDISNIPFENIEQFNRYCNELDLEALSGTVTINKQFNIPQHYLDLDVEEYITKLIPNVEDQTDKLVYLKRVEQELALFKARNLFPVLQLLIYIVDTMRKHNLVWGVGRGSSVASYCLYLIGVHKIDSVKYNLDIHEFLKRV